MKTENYLTKKNIIKIGRFVYAKINKSIFVFIQIFMYKVLKELYKCENIF